MTAQTRSVLKGVFETGDTPTGTNFADLIDSFLSLQDTGEQTITSTLKVGTLHATTEVSAANVKSTGLVVTKATAGAVSAQAITTSALTVLSKATVAAVSAQNITTSALTVLNKATVAAVSAQNITTSALTVLNKATVAEVSAQRITTSALTVSFLIVSALATAHVTASVLNDQDGTMALPSTAQGYFTVEICGQTMAVPYFTVA